MAEPTSGLAVLRLAHVDRPRKDLSRELARLVGGTVDIKVAKAADPAQVAMLVRSLGAVAVLADSWLGDLSALRRAVAPVPVLRQMARPRDGDYPGMPDHRFHEYGRLTDDGTVEPLPDGALAP